MLQSSRSSHLASAFVSVKNYFGSVKSHGISTSLEQQVSSGIFLGPFFGVFHLLRCISVFGSRSRLRVNAPMLSCCQLYPHMTAGGNWLAIETPVNMCQFRPSYTMSVPLGRPVPRQPYQLGFFCASSGETSTPEKDQSDSQANIYLRHQPFFLG